MTKTIDLTAADALLASGIQRQEVRKVAKELLARPSGEISPEAKEKAAVAIATCATISADIRELRKDVHETLSRAKCSDD